MVYEVVVVGGGVQGLATAYHLARRGVRRLALVEQFGLGHRQGSSHGHSRITRSSYSAPRYVELIQHAHREEWPRWSKEAGTPLLHPTVGCFFGPGNASYVESVMAVPEVAGAVQVVSPAEARRDFPAFRFPDSHCVLRDTTCAVVAAGRTLAWLAHTVSSQATVWEHWPVERLDLGGETLGVIGPRGELRAERIVLTAGGWLGRLLPELESGLRVAHQDVGYFALPGAAELPVWVYVPEEGESYYGLPEFGRPGAKIARHRTGRSPGAWDAPERQAPEGMPAQAEEDLRRFLERQFQGAPRLVGYEPCLYTNTVSEDFLLDCHPQEPRLVIGSACSGHGFKFAPLVGRILADLALDGTCRLETFVRHREAFAWSSVKAW